jgi:hypothetical protein
MLELNRLAEAITQFRRKGQPERTHTVKFYEDHVTISPPERDHIDDDIETLPEPLKTEALELRAKIRALVPDDVIFTLSFNEHSIGIGFEYDDGTTGSFGGEKEYYRLAKLLSDLKRTDWDKFRSEALQEMDIFDVLLADAEDRPVNIASSRQAAVRHKEGLAKSLAHIVSLRPIPPYALVLVQHDQPIEIETHKSHDEVMFSLENCLATCTDILAIVKDGKNLDFEEIEALKREAIEGLGPISRATAEGRFLGEDVTE